jgi:hypothetical protein
MFGFVTVAVIAGSVINEGHEIAGDIEDRHVNSVILAKESLFFRKIFDDECFKEANEKIVPIHLRPEGMYVVRLDLPCFCTFRMSIFLCFSLLHVTPRPGNPSIQVFCAGSDLIQSCAVSFPVEIAFSKIN